MLTIRDAQITALGLSSVHEFIERMAAHIAEDFPHSFLDMGEKGTRSFVEKTIREAGEHRVRTQGAVVAYLDLILDFGDNFERSPDGAWARRVLAHPALPDYIRLAAIGERMRSRTQGRRIIAHKRIEPDTA